MDAKAERRRRTKPPVLPIGPTKVVAERKHRQKAIETIKRPIRVTSAAASKTTPSLKRLAPRVMAIDIEPSPQVSGKVSRKKARLEMSSSVGSVGVERVV